MTGLHFCSSNRAWALGLHRAFVTGVQEKLFPSFADIDAEATAFADAEYERLGQLPGHEYGPDLSEIAAMAREAGIERYSDLVFVQGQLHSLAVAGMYHLWERTLKEFLLRGLRWVGLTEQGKKEVRRATFADLVAYMMDLGFDVKAAPFFDPLETAYLVANASKHGEGTSFQRLVKKAPNFFMGPYGDSELLKLTLASPRPDDLWVDEKSFAALAAAFTDFWQQMPEHLPIPPAWSQD